MSVYQLKATRDIDVALNDLRPKMERMDEGISQLLRRSDRPMSSAKSGYVESIFHGPRSSVIPQRMQPSSARSDTALPDPPLAERLFLQNIIAATPGQSEDQVLKSLERIKDFGDADDYILARGAIIANGHKLLECLPFLAKIRGYGTADDYSEALLVLSAHENDLQATFDWLSKIRALGTQDDYTLALAAILNNNFAFQPLEEALIWFKTMSTSPREYSCMLGYLKSKSYQLASTQDNLSTLKDVSGPHKYSDALLRLEENKFSMEKTLDELCQAKSSPIPTHAPLPSATTTLPPRSSPPFVGGFNPHLPHPSGLDLSTILPTPPLTAPPTMISFPVPPSEHGLTGQLHRSFIAPSSTTNSTTMRNKERSKWFHWLYPSQGERDEVRKRHNFTELGFRNMCQALEKLPLQESGWIHVGRILKENKFDCGTTERQMLDLSSVLGKKLDFNWALELISRFPGGGMAMWPIFGPEDARVQRSINFFRSAGISVDEVVGCLTNDAPREHSARRCAIRLWIRYELTRLGFVEEMASLRQRANCDDDTFPVFLYLLELNNLDRDKAHEQWERLVGAMGGKHHQKCSQRLGVYVLLGLKSHGNPTVVVDGFFQLLELSRQCQDNSTVLGYSTYDDILELLRLASFDFETVIRAVSEHRKLEATGRIVGGLPTLLKLVEEGKYEIGRAQTIIA
ncbi:hypothetical protein FS842_004444 [Serendipita sp. 407]|nr:hypothetical protein FS842_004444 [Serendipita sp. 407]